MAALWHLVLMAMAHFVSVILDCRRLDRFRGWDLTEPSSASRILDLDGVGSDWATLTILAATKAQATTILDIRSDDCHAGKLRSNFRPTASSTSSVSNTRVHVASIRGSVR